MDFNLLIAAALGILAVPVGAVYVGHLFRRRDPARTRGLLFLLVGIGLVGITVRWTYQVHWLDERLWGAANEGRPDEVRRLLAAGASPDARWENGKTALQTALEHRQELGTTASSRVYDEVVSTLRRAGAREPR